MSTPDRSKGDRSRDEVLAGEYVLGVLGAAERANVEARLCHDRHFAAVVRRWQENLTQFSEDYADTDRQPVPASSKLEGRMAAMPSQRGWMWSGLWNSVVFWRGLCLTALFMLSLIVGIRFGDQIRPGSGAPLVSELEAPGSLRP